MTTFDYTPEGLTADTQSSHKKLSTGSASMVVDENGSAISPPQKRSVQQHTGLMSATDTPSVRQYSVRQSRVKNMKLEALTTWAPTGLLTNELRMVVRCSHLERMQAHDVARINFELAAWNICNLLGVSNFLLPSIVDPASDY